MKHLHCLAIILGGLLLTRVCGAEVTDVIKEIPFEDVTPDGLLKDRAELAFATCRKTTSSGTASHASTSSRFLATRSAEP